jgi:acyl carrier protein
VSDDVTQQVAEIIGDMLGVGSQDVLDAPSLAELPNWDSLQQLNLLLAVEETFAIPLTTDDLPAFGDLAAISGLIAERRAGA